MECGATAIPTGWDHAPLLTKRRIPPCSSGASQHGTKRSQHGTKQRIPRRVAAISKRPLETGVGHRGATH